MHTVILILHIVTVGVFWKPDYAYLIRHCKTPDDLSYYFRRYFDYTEDRSLADNFLPPVEAIRQNRFDCEEYACISQSILEYNDYECVFYIVYNQSIDEEIEEAHAIISYQKGKIKGIMSNGINHKRMTFTEYMSEFGYRYWDIVDDYHDLIGKERSVWYE